MSERVVCAKGSGTHGVWECTDGLEDLCVADMFKKGVECPLTVRFSTIGRESGSSDLARDVKLQSRLHRREEVLIQWPVKTRAPSR